MAIRCLQDEGKVVAFASGSEGDAYAMRQADIGLLMVDAEKSNLSQLEFSSGEKLGAVLDLLRECRTALENNF